MSNYRYLKITPLLLVLLLIGCLDSNHKKMNNLYSEYSLRIRNIEDKVIDLTSATDLLRIKEFTELSKEIDGYLPIFNRFLSDRDINQTQKMIAIYSLNELRYEDFMDQFELVLADLKVKLFESALLVVFIYPGAWWNNHIIKEYKNPKSREALTRCKEILPTEYAPMLDNIILGYIWMTIDEERSYGQPKWLQDWILKY